MPYTTRQSDGKVTVSKKVGGHSKVVGHTTPGKKDKYLAALHIHSKDAKKESVQEGPGYDNQVGEIFVVQRPVSHDMDCQSLVHRVDPVQGIQSMGVDPSAIHGAYPDEDQAMQVAEKLQKEFTDAAIMLEKKKQHTIDRIKEAIDSLEAMRSESVNMIKENPKDSQEHKDKIAHLATKIDDLMQKLERIEGAKKEIAPDKEEKKKDSKKKKDLKESNLNIGDNLQVGDRFVKRDNQVLTIKKIDGDQVHLESDKFPGKLWQWPKDIFDSEVKSGQLKWQPK